MLYESNRQKLENTEYEPNNTHMPYLYKFCIKYAPALNLPTLQSLIPPQRAMRAMYWKGRCGDLPKDFKRTWQDLKSWGYLKNRLLVWTPIIICLLHQMVLLGTRLQYILWAYLQCDFTLRSTIVTTLNVALSVTNFVCLAQY